MVGWRVQPTTHAPGNGGLNKQSLNTVDRQLRLLPPLPLPKFGRSTENGMNGGVQFVGGDGDGDGVGGSRG